MELQESDWGYNEGDWVCKECGNERFDFELKCDECHADNQEFTDLLLSVFRDIFGELNFVVFYICLSTSILISFCL